MVRVSRLTLTTISGDIVTAWIRYFTTLLFKQAEIYLKKGEHQPKNLNQLLSKCGSWSTQNTAVYSLLSRQASIDRSHCCICLIKGVDFVLIKQIPRGQNIFAKFG